MTTNIQSITTKLNKHIKTKGLKKSWVAAQVDIKYQTFVDKLKNNRLTAEDLLKIAIVTDMNLEELKEEFLVSR